MTGTSSSAGRGSAFALVAAAVVVAGCAARAPAAVTATASVATPSGDGAAILHLLDRTTFGPRPGDIEAVRREGVAAFIDRQLHPDRIDDGALEQRVAALPTYDASPRMLADEYIKPAEMERRRRQAEVAQPAASASTPPPRERPPEPEVFVRERLVLTDLSAQKILRAAESHRQLQEVLVDFWFNHFNVFASKGADRLYVADFERAVIRPRVFARFRDLLGEVAASPAMLFYLDNWLSTDPNGPHAATPARPTAGNPASGPHAPARPAPAPARARSGLNENYARELMELHTLGVDGGYTQRDVTEVARCFTGWTIAGPNDGGGFAFDPRRHDEGSKVVLGHVIPAGGGQRDGELVLDILAAHPSTARFIATKLARRFVSDDPPKSLVDRAAARFKETGGDLREVVRTILASREFASVDARGAKTKTPLEFVVSAVRATGARLDDPSAAANAVRSLGMPLYGCVPPTGYVDRGEAWTTAGSLVARMNLAIALSSNRMRGIVVDLPSLAGGGDPVAANARLSELILGPSISSSTVAVLARQRSLAEVAALALGSPEFQKR